MNRRLYFSRIIVILLALLLLWQNVALGETGTEMPPPPVVRVVNLPEEMDFWGLEKSLQVFCIPVGAQDCFLIVCDGHAMILDCASVGREPTPDYLFRLLDALHIQKLDYAVNTHPHRDHFNGFGELLAKVPVNEFLTVFPLGYDKYQRMLIRAIKPTGMPIREYAAGDPLTLGSAQISTFRYKKSRNVNDLSLVVHIGYGERSILFTADIMLTAQRKMAVEYGEQWRADILKLPHHGMGGLSVDMYDIVRPALCFATNGETSRSVKTMKTFLEKRGVPLFFTSRQPLVMITDGHMWEVQQWLEDSIQLPDYTLIPPPAPRP